MIILNPKKLSDEVLFRAAIENGMPYEKGSRVVGFFKNYNSPFGNEDSSYENDGRVVKFLQDYASATENLFEFVRAEAAAGHHIITIRVTVQNVECEVVDRAKILDWLESKETKNG